MPIASRLGRTVCAWKVVSMPSSREFAALFTAALDAVLVVDDARVVVAINPAGCRLLGRPERELVGRRFEEFLERPVDVEAAWDAFLASGQQIGQLRVVRADGATCDVEYSATARFVPDRHLAILRDITERTEAQAREALRLRESETLLAVSRTLSSTLDPTETMRRVAREIAHALKADMVGAYRADAGDGALWPVAGYRVPREMLEAFRQFPIPIRHHAAIEEAWISRRPVWTSDMPGDERVDRDTYRRFPHQSDVFVPVCIKGRPVGGFFVIWWRERRRLEEAELRLLEGISALAGIFLENAQLYREAAEASRAKDEFMATLSHELRNPLGAIAYAVAALDHRGGREDAEVRLRQIIHRQTRHLARLVDELLDLARVIAGKVSLNHQAVDLGELVDAAVRAVRDGGRDREHHITARTEPVTVNADPLRLEQIVTNLLDNALKYTPSGGMIDVAVRREGQEAVLRVKDTGRGITPEMLPRLFQLFAQGEQPLDRSRGGLGIGLALCQRLVELHGGGIQAFSPGPGQGAEFVVRLPAVLPATPATAASTPRPAARRRILIVEDNADARDSLRLLLESLGHQVMAAADGHHGLALALEREPDVMLVDLGLPGLDGFEVARAVRASGLGKTARLIALTGYGQAADRRRSAEAGFDAHLVKPVSQAALVSMLGAAPSGG